MSQSAGCQQCEKEYSHVVTHTQTYSETQAHKRNHVVVRVRAKKKSNPLWAVEENVHLDNYV